MFKQNIRFENIKHRKNNNKTKIITNMDVKN